MSVRNSRFEELERKFMDLEHRLANTAEKEAISVLHAMIQECRRSPAFDSSGFETQSREGGSRVPGQVAIGAASGTTLEDIATLYKTAPPMEGKAENQGLQVGIQAPNFSLRDSSGKMVSLEEFRGKNVALVFYPLDWSPACSDQLSLYQSELDEFTHLNTQVIGVSVDSLYSHGAWAAVRGIQFPLLSDFHPKGEVAECYKVYRNTDGFSERALFVIDRDGVIRHTTISPEIHMIPDIYELFDQLKALQSETVSGRSG